MKKLTVAMVLAGSLISVEAHAQERAGSAALGALSGLIVFGPIGAAAGAVVGYTAGPEIAHSWGVRQPAPRSRVRRTARSGTVTKQPAVAGQTALPVAKTSPRVANAPETVAATKPAPPAARIADTPPPAAPARPSIASTQPAPPIQVLE